MSLAGALFLKHLIRDVEMLNRESRRAFNTVFPELQPCKKRRFSLKVVFLLSAYLVFTVFFVTGCATDKIGYELVDYVNHGVLGISQLEVKALERYAAVTGANYSTDEAVLDALKNDVIPLYGRFVDLLSQISLESDEVRNLHSIYRRGAEQIFSGFKFKLQALEKKDAALMQSANSQIEAGRVLTEQWQKELQALFEAHGVKTTKDSEPSTLKRKLIEPIPD